MNTTLKQAAAVAFTLIATPFVLEWTAPSIVMFMYDHYDTFVEMPKLVLMAMVYGPALAFGIGGGTALVKLASK